MRSLVAAVEHQQRPRLVMQLLSDRNLVLLAVGDHSIAGQKPIVIQHQMQLDGALGAPERAQSKTEAHRSITVASMRSACS